MPVSYSSLLVDVPEALYAQNSALVAKMPTIIEEAEDQLMLVMERDLFQTLLTSYTVGSNTHPPPANSDILDLTGEDPPIMEVRSIRLAHGTGFVPLERRDVEAMSMLYTRGIQAQPRFYAEIGSFLRYRIFPYPDKLYAAEINANVRPLRLSLTQQTNVFTSQFPRALKSSTLHRAAVFMKNAKDEAHYREEMTSAVLEANAQVQRRKRDETGRRPVDTTNMQGA